MLTEQQVKVVADLILKMETESSLSGERTAMQELSAAQAEITKLRAKLAQEHIWSEAWKVNAKGWANFAEQLIDARAELVQARAELAKRIEFWECPDCAFRFSAEHVDNDGKHSCPVCAEAKLRAELITYGLMNMLITMQRWHLESTQ